MAIQAGLTAYEGELRSPQFRNASPDAQRGYLREVVLPKAFPEFAKADVKTQNDYIEEVIAPAYELAPLPPPPPMQPLTPQFQPQGVAPALPPAFNPEPVENVLPPTLAPLQAPQTPQPSFFDNAGAIAQGVGAGIANGLVPGIIPRQNLSENPLTRMSESVARLPVGLGANMLFNIPTGGLYNAAYGALANREMNVEAQAAARQQGNTELLARLQANELPSAALGAASGFASSKLPLAFGKGILPKVASGLGLGYAGDVLTDVERQAATEGRVDPRTLNYNPGLGTLIGAAGTGLSLLKGRKATQGTARPQAPQERNIQGDQETQTRRFPRSKPPKEKPLSPAQLVYGKRPSVGEQRPLLEARIETTSLVPKKTIPSTTNTEQTVRNSTKGRTNGELGIDERERIQKPQKQTKTNSTQNRPAKPLAVSISNSQRKKRFTQNKLSPSDLRSDQRARPEQEELLSPNAPKQERQAGVRTLGLAILDVPKGESQDLAVATYVKLVKTLTYPEFKEAMRGLSQKTLNAIGDKTGCG